jgi:hypothetical protein
MNLKGRTTSVLLGLALTIVLIITAFLAAGVLNDLLVPPEEEPVPAQASLSIVRVESASLVGGEEREHPDGVVEANVEYDLGLRLQGVANETGVRMNLFVAMDGISMDDVEAYYYDRGRSALVRMVFVDLGDELRAVVGPQAGQTVTEGMYQVNTVILIFKEPGAYQLRAFAELVQ